MVMTDDGEVEGACAESRGTIPAKIRVVSLETRDRIGAFPWVEVLSRAAIDGALLVL
jgi:hypothetical protein